MRQMYNVYKVTRFVYSQPRLITENDEENEEAYKQRFIGKFLEHHHTNKRRLSEAYEMACKKKYIKFEGNNFEGHFLQVTVDKGYKLLDGWKYFPIGMWDEVLSEFKTS